MAKTLLFLALIPLALSCSYTQLYVNGVTYYHSVSSGQYNYYQFDYTSSNPWMVISVSVSSGDADLYGSTIVGCPSSLSYTWSLTTVGSELKNISNALGGSATEYLGVYGFSAGTTFYSISVYDDSNLNNFIKAVSNLLTIAIVVPIVVVILIIVGIVLCCYCCCRRRTTVVPATTVIATGAAPSAPPMQMQPMVMGQPQMMMQTTQGYAQVPMMGVQQQPQMMVMQQPQQMMMMQQPQFAVRTQ